MSGIGWSPKRAKFETSASHYNDGRSKSHVGFVNPMHFLHATTRDNQQLAQIANRAGQLNKDELTQETQSPFFEVHDGQIVSHEGRHRMSALAQQGYKSVPVAIHYSKASHLTPTDSVTFQPQFKGRNPVTVSNLVPLNRDYNEQIKDMMEQHPEHFQDGGSIDQDGITAYHGSPHEFEQFDTSKIGTGEGAQAYGHGLYFAQAEPTAQKYRDALSGRNAYVIDHILQHAPEMKHVRPDTIADIRMYSNATRYDPMAAAFWAQSANSELRKFDQAKLANVIASHRNAARGHMYEVNINAHPDHLLDWDKPLSEQSEHVRKALTNLARSNDSLMDGIKDIHERNANADQLYGHLTQHFVRAKKYEGMRNGMQEKDATPSLEFGQKLASEILGNYGIKGIKYLDALSRDKTDKPTHNYVVFNDKDVHVKRRYEQGGAVEGYAEGGDVWDDSRIQRSGEGGTETPLDFIRNAPLYEQRMKSQQPAPAPQPAAENRSMPPVMDNPPAIVQQAPAQPAPAVPIQQIQAQPQAQGQIGLYHIGTNDIDPNMTVQSAQRMINASRSMGITPIFLLPNQTARGLSNRFVKGDDGVRVANNSYALQKYLDDQGIQYVMPDYNNKADPYHITPEWTKNFAKAYESPFIAGDSNAVRLNMLGYKAKVPDGKTVVDPSSGANLSWGAQTSKTIANELEKYLRWKQQNTQRNSGGRIGFDIGGAVPETPTLASVQSFFDQANLVNQQKEAQASQLAYQQALAAQQAKEQADAAAKAAAAKPKEGLGSDIGIGGGGGEGGGGGGGGFGGGLGSDFGGGIGGRDSNNADATGTTGGNAGEWFKGGRVYRNTGGPVNVSKAEDTAGNYKKEHERIQGVPVSVEVKEGHDRVKYNPDGSLKFKAKQYADYGAILGSKDADGMDTDVMVGPHKDSDKVYIIDQQKHKTGKFDEHKVLMGFNKRKKAIKAYVKSYADRHGKDRVQDVVKTNIKGLKKWLKNGNLKKPAAKDALIKSALEVVSKKA